MSLANRLKQIRKDKELSQQQLADLSNVHISNIGRYERGDAQPSAEVLNRIARALEVSDFLMNGTIQDKAESSLSDNELSKPVQEGGENYRTIKNGWEKSSSMLSFSSIISSNRFLLNARALRFTYYLSRNT